MKANPRFKKYHLWVSNHQKLFLVLIIGSLCALGTWEMLQLQAPIWCIILVDLVIYFSGFIVAAFSNIKLTTLAVTEMCKTCDPILLWEELERQLSLTKSEQQQQMLTIDKCRAALYLGEYDQALNILNSINIDQFKNTLPFQKVAYYNNLCAAYTNLDLLEQADACYRKQVEIYDGIKKETQKKGLHHFMEAARASALYRGREYTAAIELFSALPSNTLMEQVLAAFSIAKCHLALDQKDEAREWLRFVVKNGNKLAVVQEANNLLEQL